VLCREPPRYRDGLRILDLGREPAAPLRVGEPLALLGEVAFGPHDRVARLDHRDLGFDHGFPHLPRQVAQISRRRRRVEGGTQAIPQALEHGS